MTGRDLGEPEITDLDERPAVSIRVKERFPDLDIPKLFDEYVPRIYRHLETEGPTPNGPPHARYYDFGPDDYDIEIGVMTTAVPNLAATDADGGALGSSALPAGRAARIEHFGDYQTLGSAYERLSEFIGEKSLTPGLGPYEVYVDPGEPGNPATARTEVFWPLG